MGVKIREQKLKDGIMTLYLDVFHKGQRTTQIVNLKFASTDKAAKARATRVAQIFKIRIEDAILSEMYDIGNQSGKKVLLRKYLGKPSISIHKEGLSRSPRGGYTVVCMGSFHSQGAEHG
ncbi:MAG: hypothetical protein ACLQMF_09185 [Rectinemataceae bacterium]